MRAITRRGLTACSAVRAEAQPLQLRRRASSPPAHRRAPPSCSSGVAVALQVQHDRQLVAPMHAEPDRVPVHRRAPAAERVAARRLDLDHLGAEIGQDAGAEGRGDVVADLQHLQADERAGTRAAGSASRRSCFVKCDHRERRFRGCHTPPLPFHKSLTAILPVTEPALAGVLFPPRCRAHVARPPWAVRPTPRRLSFLPASVPRAADRMIGADNDRGHDHGQGTDREAGARRRAGQGAGGVPRRCRGRGRSRRCGNAAAAIEVPTDPRGRALAADARGDRAMSELHWLTAAEAARAFAARELSPVELLTALLDRIERLDPKLNAFIRLDAEAAMDGRARGRDRDRRGPAARTAAWRAGRHQGHHRCRRPADDLPFEDPDRQRRDGRRGRASRSCAAPARSSWASCRRTNSPSAARASTCRGRRRATRGTRTIIPAARRPARAPACAPGCSRWRSAPTPAAACAIRPAACGIVGLKPTYGLVSRRGVFPLSFTLDHVGPMTRTVADNALMLEAIAGHDPLDPGSAADAARGIIGRMLDRGVRGLRVGFVRHFHEIDMPAASRGDRGARGRRARAAGRGRGGARRHAAVARASSPRSTA